MGVEGGGGLRPLACGAAPRPSSAEQAAAACTHARPLSDPFRAAPCGAAVPRTPAGAQLPLCR